MRRRIAWTARALDDLSGVRAYIARENPSAAKRTDQRIVQSCAPLQRFPELGRESELPGLRDLVVPGTPYLVFYSFYSVTGQTVRIDVVWDGRRGMRPYD